jgi:putative SOS response-associated peptidase YedK
MCGRFTLAMIPDEMRDHFIAKNTVDNDPWYNVALTYNIPR